MLHMIGAHIFMGVIISFLGLNFAAFYHLAVPIPVLILFESLFVNLIVYIITESNFNVNAK